MTTIPVAGNFTCTHAHPSCQSNIRGLFTDSCGQRSFRDRLREEIELTKVEVDRSLEALFVLEPPSVSLDLLAHRIELLGAGVCCAGNDSSQDALDMTIDRFRQLLDRLKPRADGLAIPALAAGAEHTCG